MKTWLRSNGRPVLISVLLIVLIAITVSRPAWQDNIGYRLPKQTVPYGHSAVLGGVRWELTSIKPPDQRQLQQYALFPDELGDDPPKSRLATYLWQRTKDGKPASVPTGFTGCDLIARAGKRRWTSKTSSIAVDNWAKHLGYVNLCHARYNGPLFVAFVVPADVQLTSIDVEFIPDSWGDQKRLSKPSDLLVIRFDTG
jgi:hypothetical protein